MRHRVKRRRRRVCRTCTRAVAWLVIETRAMTKSVRVLLTCVALALVASIASAQGVQTGTLTGTVRDQANLPLPGAAVTVTSTALQGARTAATDANGVYALAGLPPGLY